MRKLPISLCMIVRDEAEDIADCLRAAEPFVEEMIVVDTGSTDDTVQIAKECGAEVHKFEWNDDFSAARNASLEHAKKRWVLVLDADERVDVNTLEGLEDLLDSKDIAGFEVSIDNLNDRGLAQSFRIIRLFRNSADIYFTGAIHETVLEPLLEFCRKDHRRIEVSNVHIKHHGYLSARIAKKGERNLQLIRTQLQQHPANLYLRLKEYEELEKLGRTKECDDKIEETFRMLFSMHKEKLGEYPFIPLIIGNFAQTRINRGAHDEALAAADWGLRLYHDEPWLLYYRALAQLRLGRLDEAEEGFTKCLGLTITPSEYYIEPGIASWLSVQQLGAVNLHRGNIKKAVSLLERSLDVRGNNVEALRLLVEAYLQAKDLPTAVKHCMDILRIDGSDLWALVNGGRILAALNMKDRAREWLNRALAIQPNLPEAQAILQQL